MNVRLKPRFFLICILCGIIFRVYETKVWFALSDYEIVAQSQQLEQRLWDIIPKRDLGFWPYLLKDSDGFREFLERDMPVTVETTMTKFGKFKTEIKWLEPSFKVLWHDKLWYISQEGKMWALDDEINRNFHGKDPKIIWKIKESQNANVKSDDLIPLFGVFKTPLSTQKMENFMKDFDNHDWFEFVSEVTWERRAGSDLFTLNLAKNNQNFRIILQPDKYPEQDLGALIDKIFEMFAQESGNLTIDATYEKKILLQGL